MNSTPVLLYLLALWTYDAAYASLRGDIQRKAYPSLHHSRQHANAISSRSYSNIPGFDCFHDIQGMTDAMFDLEKEYPDLVSIQSIGKSFSQDDIYAMKITVKGKSSSKGIVLLTGGVHAREYAPPELLMRFATDVLEKYDKDADTTWILEHTEIHIVFYVNPDGRHKAEEEPNTMWRKNVDPGNDKCSDSTFGVDINRNFDFLWGDINGASKYPCDDDYMGTSPASEPETQALTEYAKSLFPEAQRKSDPVGQMDEPFGEDIMGLYMDIHAYGGFTYYPWGHKDAKSPDNASLEALGRKISSFNGYDLWAGGQPDFQYPVSGDTSDYMYAVLGVASFGLEIGKAFYESCAVFENNILPSNLPALLYAAKVSKKPNSLAKGPDVMELVADIGTDGITVTATASDSKLVNIVGYPDFETGGQTVSGITLSLDVHPDDLKGGSGKVDMSKDGNGFQAIIGTNGLSSGRHILYAQARDSDGYLGPVSSIFVVLDGSPSSPSSTPTGATQSPGEGAGTWDTIVDENFDSGYGAFAKRGVDVRHISKAKTRDGVVRIQQGNIQSKFDTSYSQYNVVFSAFFRANTNSKLCLDYRTKGTWNEVQCWSGEKLDPQTWHDDISAKFNVDSTSLAIRFQYKGNNAKDYVFLDSIKIQGEKV
eukprot:CCRYP_002628-RC/>CCRYP_002628-RC protein AED:0.04 eAED:0.04 QI:260/1/1/1/0.75/0.6/5/5197/651